MRGRKYKKDQLFVDEKERETHPSKTFLFSRKRPFARSCQLRTRVRNEIDKSRERSKARIQFAITSHHGRRRAITCSFCVHKFGLNNLIDKASRMRKIRSLRARKITLKWSRKFWRRQSHSKIWDEIAEQLRPLPPSSSHLGTCSRIRTAKRWSSPTCDSNKSPKNDFRAPFHQ